MMKLIVAGFPCVGAVEYTLQRGKTLPTSVLDMTQNNLMVMLL